ncbi:MAG TPA: phosphohistidine phosphatase SixA [Candidatus Eisenbacteria bacterium]|nr:phosphohistidine phosphatase SixA [Candidatus Eisenbacteria bacterium]
MHVILFRHGPAGHPDPSRWPDDDARPLTPRGEERTRRAARGLERLLPGVDLVVSSPLARARQTAELACECWPEAARETFEGLRPGGSARAVVAFLAALAPDTNVVLVGHEPELGKLAGTLVFGAPVALALRKAGACAIRFAGELKPGTGALEWFLPPRALRRLARRTERV